MNATTTAPVRAIQAHKPVLALAPPAPGGPKPPSDESISIEDTFGPQLRHIGALLFVLTHTYGGDTVLEGNPSDANGIAETFGVACALAGQMLADAQAAGFDLAPLRDLTGMLSLLDALDVTDRFSDAVLCNLFDACHAATQLAIAVVAPSYKGL